MHTFTKSPQPRTHNQPSTPTNINIIFWHGLSKLFYAKRPNSNFLFCELELTLIFQHFVEALGPRVCFRSKICIEHKDQIFARPFRVVLCKNAKFQLFIKQTWIYLTKYPQTIWAGAPFMKKSLNSKIYVPYKIFTISLSEARFAHFTMWRIKKIAN